MPSPADLTVPRHHSHAGAWGRGYAARLHGQSKYANPYGDAIEQRAVDGRPAGWLHGYFQSWSRGWLAADHLVGEDR